MATTSVYSTRFKVVATLVLAVAGAAFVLAYLSAQEGDDDPLLTTGTSEIVETLMPRRDSQVPQQTSIGIDLVSGWTGTLLVNDVEIPQDQLTVTPELALIEFSPGDGRAIEELAAGRNCVTAVVWPIAEG
ncbi:MAG: hypothetical protein ACRDZN_01125, partial [Acidimicrobiales bacterium]